MHTHYKSLLKNGVNRRSKQYKGISQEDWEYMIYRIWTTNKIFKVYAAQLLYSYFCDFFTISR